MLLLGLHTYPLGFQNECSIPSGDVSSKQSLELHYNVYILSKEFSIKYLIIFGR